MHKDLKILFDVAAREGLSVCVAGGAAFDYKLASDIDLWVLDVEHRVGDAQRLALALAENEHDLERNDAPSVQLVEDPSYADDSDHMLVARVVVPGISKGVDILTATHLTPEELISSFDVSTHMWAVKPPHHLVADIDKTTTRSQEVRISRFTTPEATMKRATKIALRYGLTINESDWRKAEALIAKRGLNV
jgi:hypothetical protein